jgi:ElaA protein
MTPVLRSASPREVDPVTLYRILQLRVDVFVVEQACIYRELDGRDLEPNARWFWIEHRSEVLATLRTLTEPDGSLRIGRVATAKSARTSGLASKLMHAALDDIGDEPVSLTAQSHLEGWYAGFGFVRDGSEFVEDGIPHIPMSWRRPRTAGGR